MEDLRSEIRAAFEKEQAAHPPTPALRRQIVAAVNAQPMRETRLQWVAVAAAVLLGLLVVGGLMATRLAHHAPVPTRSVDNGPPPAGIPLLYVHDPTEPSWLIGYDWSGKPRGTVKLGSDLAQGQWDVQMSPDGSGFELGGTYKGGTGVFLDRLGDRVATETGETDVVGAMWADDNKHQCLITVSPTVVWSLNTQLPGQALRPVTVIARDPGIGQSGISLIACSFKNNLAIALRTTISWPAELWLLRLSDGKVLSHHTYAPDLLVSIVASTDASYIAENPNGSAPSRIRRVSDWSVVSSLTNSYGVRMFSGDGSLLLTVNGPDNPILASQMQVIEWRSNRVIWTYDGPDTIGSFTAQPDGRDFALAFKRHDLFGQVTPCSGTDTTPCGWVEDALRDVVIVHGDGSTIKVTSRVTTIW